MQSGAEISADGERPEPKFQKGQVVILSSVKRQLPFRILDMIWNDGWFYAFYAWNRKNYAAEHMLRALTLEEAGVRRVAS